MRGDNVAALSPQNNQTVSNSYTYDNYRLKTISHNGFNYSFNYDSFGNVTQTKVGSQVLSTNTYGNNNGDRLQYETLGGSSALWYFYDADGNPSGIRYKDNSGTVNDYYFVCNWRGDVIQIYNASGTLVGSYTYDAWGKVTENATSADTQNITETNPIRYRGYYYDTETRLYYLKSRYYDPAVKRFLNGDKLLCTTERVGFNLYAYCYNNPSINKDPNGNCPYNGTMADFRRFEHGLPPIGCTCNTNKGNNSTQRNVVMSKKATNRRDSGLSGYSDEEIKSKARDKSLPGKERRRYQEEEKVRGLRNKQKRASHFSFDDSVDLAIGVSLITASIVLTGYVLANDSTVIGVVDDFLLVPLGKIAETGYVYIYQTIEGV